MAIKYGFFNSQGGDRKYTAADIGEYLHGIITSGVYADASDSLQVLSAGELTVEVQPGRAMLNFKYLENDAPLALTLSAGGTQDRVDAIVARMSLNDRLCEIVVKEGTPAASPVAPSMTRTDVTFEIMLASVYVAKLASSITQSSITDTRANTAVCGYVTGAIQQLDTSTLWAQYRAANEEKLAENDAYLAAQRQAWEIFLQEISNDTVFPVPSIDDAAKIVTVNQAGDGYELLPTDTTVSFSGAPADAAATRALIKAQRIPAKNKQVAVSAWDANTTYPDYPYRAAVSISGVDAGMFPQVAFSLADAMSGTFAPVAECYNGGVYIYAASKPDAAITIPSIMCWRTD